MDIHFDTPSRLERQIAQDLLNEQSDLDISIPNHRLKPDPTHRTNPNKRSPLSNLASNQLSFSRASTSSLASSFYRDDSINNDPLSPPPRSKSPPAATRAKAENGTTRPPPSLASALANLDQGQQKASTKGEDPNPNHPHPPPSSSSSSSSYSSSSTHPPQKRGSFTVSGGSNDNKTTSTAEAILVPGNRNPLVEKSSPSAVNSNASSFSSYGNPEEEGGYGVSQDHRPPQAFQRAMARAISPPLTSTPQRPGPASTVGSRTTMTIRPNRNNQSMSRTTLNTTLGSTSVPVATNASGSGRSSRLFQDLSASFIGSDPGETDEVHLEERGEASQHQRDEDRVGEGQARRERWRYQDQEEVTDTMHTSDITPPRLNPSQAETSLEDAVGGGGDTSQLEKEEREEKGEEQEKGFGLFGPGWKRRRRRGEFRDDSMVEEEEEEEEKRRTEMEPSRGEEEGRGEGGEEEEDEEDESNREDQSSVKRLYNDDTRPSQVETEGGEVGGEGTTTTFSSPAAAKLARQEGAGIAMGATTNTTTTPKAKLNQEKMKAYLLNSVKASATRGSANVRNLTLSRVAVLQSLNSTPGALPHPQPPFTPDSYDSMTTNNETDDGDQPRTTTTKGRMDRLGKANTLGAGRTPIARGGVVELLRRNRERRISSSYASSSAGGDLEPRLTSTSMDRNLERDALLESMTSGSEASSSTTNDLTVPTTNQGGGSRRGLLGLRANTSFPGLGAAEVGTEANATARPRVDPARLALYQSKLNARLDAENEELRRERDKLRQEVQRLMSGVGNREEEREVQDDQEASVESKGRSGSSQRQKVAATDASSEVEREEEARELEKLLEEREEELEGLKVELERERRKAAVDFEGREEEKERMRFQISELEAQIEERDEDLAAMEERMENERRRMESQVEQAKAYSFQTLEKVEEERDQAMERVTWLEGELERARNRERKGDDTKEDPLFNRMRDEIERLTNQIEKLQARIVSLESDLEEALERQESPRMEEERRKVFVDLESQVEMLKQEIESLETERRESREDMERMESMEEEIKESRREVKDLESQLIKAKEEAKMIDSLKAENEVKEVEIGVLRESKAQLERRLEEYRGRLRYSQEEQDPNQAEEDRERTPKPTIRRPTTNPKTPARKSDKDPSSPIHRSILNLKQITPFRTPRSPAELSEASWLYNESSLGAGGVAERIAILTAALDEANESIDEKLERLDRAGVAHLTLTERLAKAQARIRELEEELERLRGGGGGGRDKNGSWVDSERLSSSVATLASSVVQRQKVFKDVHAQLEGLKAKWAEDQKRLNMREVEIERRERELAASNGLGLQDDKQGSKMVREELERFRKATESLQDDLRSEQERQRRMLEETRRTNQEKSEIERELKLTRSELQEVRERLKEKMQGLEDISTRYLKSSACAEARTEGLNEDLVERARKEVWELKEEKKQLLEQRGLLHEKFNEVNERYEAVRADLELSRQALEAHQAQLDEQIARMEGMHAALRERNRELRAVSDDRDRLKSERDGIVKDVGKFEVELRRLRIEADRQGFDLETLRRERKEEERRKMDQKSEWESQRRHLEGRLQKLQAKVEEDENEIERLNEKLAGLLGQERGINQPPPYNQDSTSASHQADSRRLELELFRSKETMERLKGHHSEECKGLMLQIRYLKLKMMRESDQRQDLIHQKSYIVKLLSGFFQVDRVVERILFELEIPSGGGLQRRNDSEAKRRWNKVIIVARSIARMKLMREKWEKLDEIKQTLNQAHLQARSRRLTSKKVKGEEEEGGGEETIRRLPVKHRDEGRGVKK